MKKFFPILILLPFAVVAAFMYFRGGTVQPRDVGNWRDKQDLIQVKSPRPNDTIRSPLTVYGEARGYWFFEASFPVRILDANGKELVVVPAQAEGEWMTEIFVPFRVTLVFPSPTTETGTLVLEKDNPSGLPEHADELRMPIRFDKNNIGSTPSLTSECEPTGCSGEICAEKGKPIVSTCIYKPEYACYKTARCERQKDLKCGWTPTPELASCLEQAAGDNL